MKLYILILLLMVANYSQAQIARAILEDACKDGAILFSKIARTNVIETYKIASETEANSPDRVRRLQMLESERDYVIGQLKKMNRDQQEEWIKKGISRDIASLRRKTLDSTIFISMSLAYKNPNWDTDRLILETQEHCEK